MSQFEFEFEFELELDLSAHDSLRPSQRVGAVATATGLLPPNARRGELMVRMQSNPARNQIMSLSVSFPVARGRHCVARSASGASAIYERPTKLRLRIQRQVSPRVPKEFNKVRGAAIACNMRTRVQAALWRLSSTAQFEVVWQIHFIGQAPAAANVELSARRAR